MKALILAAGRGKRMQEHCDAQNKCLITVHGRQLLEYNLAAAAALDAIEEIIVVVGYQAESIINRYGIAYGGKRLRYRIQYDQMGLVHAIATAAEDLDGHDFFLFLGDEIILNPRHREMIELFDAQHLFAVCGVVRQPDPEEIRKTYAIIQDGDGRIFRLIEKPEMPFNDIQGTGNCLFRNAILDYIPRVPIHHIRKEKELPDLIQCAVDDGHVVKSMFFCEHYINVNTKDELTRLERHWPTPESA